MSFTATRHAQIVVSSPQQLQPPFIDQQSLSFTRQRQGGLMDALEDAGASDQDDVQYVGEQNSKSSKKGGRPRDSVREHFTDTGAKDSIKKRAPCKCNYCSQQFTASTAEVATLRDHILHKCKHAPAAARQQLLQQQAQKIDPAAASASAPCCWGQQVPQQQQFRQQLCAAGDRAVLCWQQRERCAARVDRPCPATPDEEHRVQQPALQLLHQQQQ